MENLFFEFAMFCLMASVAAIFLHSLNSGAIDVPWFSKRIREIDAEIAKIDRQRKDLE